MFGRRKQAEAEAAPIAPTIAVDRDLYKLHRDYIQHEDGLIVARLGSFLTLTSFLLAASMLVLSGMLTAVAKASIGNRELFLLMIVGGLVHFCLTQLGYRASVLTDTSIRAAISSLQEVRNRGNRLFAEHIEAGLVPALTNGRVIPPNEDMGTEKGVHFMRHLPRYMQWLWMVIATSPLIIIVAAAAIRLWAHALPVGGATSP